MRLIFLAAASATMIGAALIPDVRTLVNAQEFAKAESTLAEFEKANGRTPEWLEAQSWLGRGALNGKNYELARKYAAETRKLCLAELKKRPMDEEPRLPIACGASMEVEAQALAAVGSRTEAVAFLREELARYRSTSLRTRLQKNLNLLALAGQPAPAVTAKEWIGAAPKPWAQYRGQPVLLFFWAHWCGDCKQQAPILGKIRAEFEPKGLAVIAPTRYYGYAARGEDAAPPAERKHAEKVWGEFYQALAGVPAPIDDETFMTYGSSTTPTLVLVDQKGLVRLYHPGKLTEAELAAEIRKVIPGS